jgi:hypothetical protein
MFPDDILKNVRVFVSSVVIKRRTDERTVHEPDNGISRRPVVYPETDNAPVGFGHLHDIRVQHEWAEPFSIAYLTGNGPCAHSGHASKCVSPVISLGMIV